VFGETTLIHVQIYDVFEIAIPILDSTYKCTYHRHLTISRSTTGTRIGYFILRRIYKNSVNAPSCFPFVGPNVSCPGEGGAFHLTLRS
jgi:hypothetical protein